MSSLDSKTLGSGRLHFADEKDVDLFVETLEKYERGEIGPDDWRAFRLLNGVYGQRQDDVMMIRVKMPLGILTPPQMEALATVAERWSTGKGHITTRQNVQFHFVKVEDADDALRLLAETGLTTKEACGNSVRNVTGSPYAGVDALEAFDVTPYGEAVVRHLLRGPWSSSLPRKFKIAFSGRADNDDIFGTINDIGAFGLVRDGRRGFRFQVGGGLSTLRRSAIVVHDFLPAEELCEAAEAVVRVFHRTGDRKNRHKARLKFVIDRLGRDGFLEEYRKEREAIAAEGGRPYELPAQPTVGPKKQVVPRPVPAEAAAFLAKNVRPQKQEGFSTVTVKITLGDLTTEQFRALARITRTFSAEEEVRTTAEQNLVFRYVADEHVGALYEALKEIGLADVGPQTVLDVVSCPGAMSCKLAVTASRGLATVVQEHLEARPEIVAKAESLTIKASGCPNSCGQHHIAGIGFQGGMKKVGGKSMPMYHLYLGGNMGGEVAQFGRLSAKIPARRSGQAVEKLIELYDAEKEEGESPNHFFGRVGLDRVKVALKELTSIDEHTATPEDYIDLGETQAFEVVLQEGECAA